MLRLLIVGGGTMAGHHARSFAADPDCTIVGLVEPDEARRDAFAAAHGIPVAFADLDAALAWGGFDAAANVTPDQAHHPVTMRLIAAGKHVFCEKPLATSHPLAMEMTEAAEARGLVNMVNLVHRGSPALQLARNFVMSGAIGEVRHVDASYLQSWLVGKYWGDWRSESRWLWRLSEAHGSKGVLGDIGIHILDFASYGAGSDIASLESRLKTFRKADGDRIGDYVLDANDSAVMTAEFANGTLGVIHVTRFATGYANQITLRVFGTAGGLEAQTDGRQSSLRICSGPDIDTLTWREVECPSVMTTYERFVAACLSGVNGEPGFRRAAELQRLLDHCFEQDARDRRLPSNIEIEPASGGQALPVGIAALGPIELPQATAGEEPGAAEGPGFGPH